jgi:hypothetical protein
VCIDMGGEGCRGVIWGSGTTTGTKESELWDSMLGVLVESDGSRCAGISPSAIGVTKTGG